jgi:hypothetical protein
LWAASTDRGSSDDVDLERAEAAIVIRPALVVDTRLMPAGGFRFVRMLKERLTLAEAAFDVAARGDEADLAAHLQGLFDMGAVTAISRDHQESKG